MYCSNFRCQWKVGTFLFEIENSFLVELPLQILLTKLHSNLKGFYIYLQVTEMCSITASFVSFALSP